MNNAVLKIKSLCIESGILKSNGCDSKHILLQKKANELTVELGRSVITDLNTYPAVPEELQKFTCLEKYWYEGIEIGFVKLESASCSDCQDPNIWCIFHNH